MKLKKYKMFSKAWWKQWTAYATEHYSLEIYFKHRHKPEMWKYYPKIFGKGETK